MKKKFIPPEIRVEQIQLNLFSTYRNDSSMVEGLLMKEVYASSNSLYLPIIISDARLKKDISPFDNALNHIIKLQPVSYSWRGTDRQVLGLLAQDVQKIIPQAVVQKAGVNMIDYAGIISLLVQAVKEQQKEIEELKQTLSVSSY